MDDRLAGERKHTSSPCLLAVVSLNKRLAMSFAAYVVILAVWSEWWNEMRGGGQEKGSARK